MVQAIFFDIDGTLVSYRKRTYSNSTKKALEKLHEKGIYLFVSTGRSVLEIEQEHLIDGLYFDGYIILNGQYCFNDKETIYENQINSEDVKNIIAQIDAHPYPCVFVEKDNMYINMINQEVINAQKAVHTSLPPVMDIHRALKNPIYQMSPFLDDEQARIYPLSILKHCKATRWNTYAMDIIPESGGKKEGIKKILQYYNVPIENTMAFGDGENDIDMLEFVSVGIAMGNAEQKVKDVADYITEDVDNDGILRALQHFGLL